MPPEDTTGASTPTPTPEQPKKPGFFAKLFGFAKRTEESTPQQNATGVTNPTDPSQTPEPVPTEASSPVQSDTSAPVPPVVTDVPPAVPTPEAPQVPAPELVPTPVEQPAPSADFTAPSTDTSTGAPQVETTSTPDADGTVTAPEVQVPPSVQTPTPGDNGTLPVQPPQNPSQNQ